MPLGIASWDDKIFITVPRWKNGVASNLNFFSKSDKSKSPKLIPYPNWEINDLRTPDGIVSIFRVRPDRCGRLWGVDTGSIVENSTFSRPTRIFVFDLETDEIIRIYPLKPSDQTDSFFVDAVVDVDPYNCEDAYLYTSDFLGNGIVVYSWAKNDSWRIEHNYFHFDPLNGDFNVSGYNFQWSDGVFGMSLSPIQSDGYKTLYFHAMSGITEFSVSTEVLQDDIMNKSRNYYAFHIEGNKGPKTQGPSSLIDQNTGIDYFTQVNRNGIACWDTSVKLNPDTFIHIAQDNTSLVFPNDLSIDESCNMLYVLSNNLPQLLFARFDGNQPNFFLTGAKLDHLTSLCKGQG